MTHAAHSGHWWLERFRALSFIKRHRVHAMFSLLHKSTLLTLFANLFSFVLSFFLSLYYYYYYYYYYYCYYYYYYYFIIIIIFIFLRNFF